MPRQHVTDEPILGNGWGPSGYRNPPDMYWNKKDGTRIYIPDMDDKHLLNCIKFLVNKFGELKISNWPVYSNLLRELARRQLDVRPDWDN